MLVVLQLLTRDKCQFTPPPGLLKGGGTLEAYAGNEFPPEF